MLHLGFLLHEVKSEKSCIGFLIVKRGGGSFDDGGCLLLMRGGILSSQIRDFGKKSSVLKKRLQKSEFRLLDCFN